MKVLFETNNIGHTTNYIEVKVDGKELENQVKIVKIIDSENGVLAGKSL